MSNATVRKIGTRWHVDCPEECKCIGEYSKYESAIARADSHMRKGVHDVDTEWEEW